MPPIPPGLKQIADNALTIIIDNMAVNQPEFMGTHNKYFQGIKTPDNVPGDGQPGYPDYDAHPHDQPEAWRAYVPNMPMPITIQVDVHDGPGGWGYSCIGYIRAGRRLYRKSVGVGAGSQTYDWVEISEEL